MTTETQGTSLTPMASTRVDWSIWTELRPQCVNRLGWAWFYLDFVLPKEEIEGKYSQMEKVNALASEAAKNWEKADAGYWADLLKRIVDETENLR